MSGKQLTNPLQNLIVKAAKALPGDTGESSRYRARTNLGGPIVILCDTSGSMDESAGSRTKIQVLRDSLSDWLPELILPRLISFGSTARLVASSADLPSPGGGTALHLGIDLAAASSPSRTLVFSDGYPDDEAAALAAAERLTGRIDTIFCGPDSDIKGREFLAKLARIGCGITMDQRADAIGARQTVEPETCTWPIADQRLIAATLGLLGELDAGLRQTMVSLRRRCRHRETEPDRRGQGQNRRCPCDADRHDILP